MCRPPYILINDVLLPNVPGMSQRERERRRGGDDVLCILLLLLPPMLLLRLLLLLLPLFSLCYAMEERERTFSFTEQQQQVHTHTMPSPLSSSSFSTTHGRSSRLRRRREIKMRDWRGPKKQQQQQHRPRHECMSSGRFVRFFQPLLLSAQNQRTCLWWSLGEQQQHVRQSAKNNRPYCKNIVPRTF